MQDQDTTNGANNASQYLIAPANYTQMPNVIFDYWQAILSPSQFSVLLCICRKTFGWHKVSDNISSKQIEAKTGLSKHTIIGAIDKLIELKLIIKIKSKTSDGDDAPNKFLINVLDVQNLGVGSAEIALGGSAEIALGVVQNLHPQKTPLTKEKNTKEIHAAAAACVSPSSPIKIKRSANVSTTEAHHEKLVATYGAEFTERCYQSLEEWKDDANRKTVDKHKCDYRRITQWVARDLKEKDIKDRELAKREERLGCVQPEARPASVMSQAEENRQFARQVAARYEEHYSHLVSAADVCIWIKGAAGRQSIGYTENNFKDRVENAIRNCNFK